MFRLVPNALAAAVALNLTATVLIAYSNQQIRIEELVSKHVDSIGAEEAVVKVNSRWVEGTVRYERLRDPHPPASGKAFFVSEKEKLRLTMQFSAQGEGGEQFIFDGHKLNVSSSTEFFRKSPLGLIVQTQPVLVKEGLLGGVLNTNWPLLNKGVAGRLSYEGKKKIDGRSAYSLRYRTEGKSDLRIHLYFLYFDSDTSRHLMSVYTFSVPKNGHSSDGLSDSTGVVVMGGETRYRLEERFGDFNVVDGLTLPTIYRIVLDEQIAGMGGDTKSFKITARKIVNNAPVDPANFAINETK